MATPGPYDNREESDGVKNTAKSMGEFAHPELTACCQGDECQSQIVDDPQKANHVTIHKAQNMGTKQNARENISAYPRERHD